MKQVNECNARFFGRSFGRLRVSFQLNVVSLAIRDVLTTSVFMSGRAEQHDARERFSVGF